MKPKMKISLVLIMALSLIWAAGAQAQLTVFNANVPPGFCQAGYIQAATLDPGGPNAGGTLTINGIKMIVPANSVIQMPANTLKWAQLFDPAVSAAVYDNSIVPKPVIPNHRPGVTGLALLDNPFGGTRAGAAGESLPFPFNATVLGNIDVKNTTGHGVGAYIVGLILPIDQDLGNAGAGFITFIDYAKGRFEAGGTLNVPNTGTVIEINDPLGRYGKAHSPDPRWSVDSDNPTISAGNGYPMGLPKVAPTGLPGDVGDPDRPYYNRPLNGDVAFPVDPFLQLGAPLQAFFMPASPSPGTTTPDPWKQVPLMIGDFVDWSGTMCKTNPTAPFNSAIPWNKQTYISANTVGVDKLAVYTQPGTLPCYVQFPIGRQIVGTGGAPIIVPANPALGTAGGVIPLPEPRLNISINGWCTDSTQLVDIFASDINPNNGQEQPRLLGTVLPEPGPPGAGNKGRFRFDIGKGNFLPPTRVYQCVSRNGTLQLPNQSGLNGAPLPGLLVGQYHAPEFGFQFPDSVPGVPVMPNNFNVLPFLTQGEGGNPSAGPLIPQPPVTP